MTPEVVLNKTDAPNRRTLPVEALKSGVLVSREKVKFSQVDSHGHLNAARYLESILNHRVEAAEDHLSCLKMDLLRELKIACVVSDSRVQYLRPSLCGEELEIAFWLECVSEHGFSFTVLITGSQSRHAKSIGKIEFGCVCAASGKPSVMPASQPSRATTDVESGCPTVDSYKKTVKLFAGGLL